MHELLQSVGECHRMNCVEDLRSADVRPMVQCGSFRLPCSVKVIFPPNDRRLAQHVNIETPQDIQLCACEAHGWYAMQGKAATRWRPGLYTLTSIGNDHRPDSKAQPRNKHNERFVHLPKGALGLNSLPFEVSPREPTMCQH